MEKLNQIQLQPQKLFRSAFRSPAIVCLLLAGLCKIASASSWNFDKGASFKSISGIQFLRQQAIFNHDTVPFNEERLRLQASLSNRDWHFEFANETSFYLQRYNSSQLPVPDPSPSSAWNAKWNLFSNRETSATTRMDRAFIQYTHGEWQVIAGKQVIATGVGQIFAAVSQVQRYPFVVIDPEYQKTEDAVSVLWSGPFQLEARFLPKTREQQNHNFHLRAKGSKGGYDVGLTAGRSDDKSFMGFETAGNLGEALLRGELVGYDQKGKSSLQGLLGLDYVLSTKWSTKIEFFYNGFGKTANYVWESFPHRSAPYRGKWYGAWLLTWEIHPLLKSNLLSVLNLWDPSALFHLYFNYSVSGSVDLLVGQFLSLGKKSSELGGRLTVAPPNFELGQPDISYAALRLYF